MADAMDSKSISRKGVGVRLPSLAPAQELEEVRRAREFRCLTEELAPLLWASLGARLGRARFELSETLTALRHERANALRDECALARQEDLREQVRRAGWCLGVLGAGQGVDLLRARRERDGLRWLLGALAEARAFGLEPDASELPQLARGTSMAFELPLLAAWCVLRASSSSARVRWRAERASAGQRLVFELGSGAEPAELATRCARLNSARPDAPHLAVGLGRLELAWL